VAATVTVTAGRTANLQDLVADVQARPSNTQKYKPATNGQPVDEGGQVRTGAGSKARISLSDGTILRIIPNTEITLDRLTSDPNNPFTRLLLVVGKVWVILRGGQLEVDTPAGLASVRGSFMSVEYSRDTNTVLVTCLEGNCAVHNSAGTTSLTTGQAASLLGPASAGSKPALRALTQAEIQAWIDDNPEARDVLPAVLTALPSATETPSATATLTPTPTDTSTPTATLARRPTLTGTPTHRLPTATLTPRPSATHTPSPVATTGTPNVGAKQPLKYSFQSLCDPADPSGPGTYHVAIDGSQSAKFDVAPGQTVTGELPPGQYSVSWVADNGTSDGPFGVFSDDGPYNQTFCGKP
jgi:hypothetical protein